MLFNLLNFYNRLNFFSTFFKKYVMHSFLAQTFFLKKYYKVADLVWQEGLLLDFLQKKVVDKWIRRTVIFSLNLFSERFVFEKVIRFFLDLIIWPSHKSSLFEFNNVSSTLFIILFFLITVIFIITLFYVGLVFNILS